MSAGGRTREVAHRLFAAEFEDATHSYSESDEERAPNYVVTPTGARVNRVFVVGVLTAVESVGEDVLRARVADPTGAFVVYAGQYQPEAVTFLEDVEVPAFVALTGKARTFEPEDGDRVYTSVRPETLNHADADTRDRWVVDAAEHTLARVAAMADALDRPERGEELEAALRREGVDPALAAGIPRAVGQYGTGRAYLGALRETALDAVRVVAGDVEEVPPLDVAVDATGDAEGTLQFERSPFAAEVPTADEDGAGDADGAGEDGAGDADGANAEGATASATTAEAGADVDDEGALEEPSYDLPEEEREEIEDEYGLDFESGEDIPEAGETDIEPEAGETDIEPEAGEAGDVDDHEDDEDAPDDAAADAGTAEAADGVAAEPAGDDGTDTEEGADADDGGEDAGGADDESEASGTAAPEDVDLEDAVVEQMRELGDGGGVERAALVETVAGEHGVDEAAVEDAVQDALMSGRCYESGDDELTPI